MQWFRDLLKTFLGLAMPNQCCPAVTVDIWLVCRWNFGQEIPTFMIPMHSITILYDRTIQYSISFEVWFDWILFNELLNIQRVGCRMASSWYTKECSLFKTTEKHLYIKVVDNG